MPGRVVHDKHYVIVSVMGIVIAPGRGPDTIANMLTSGTAEISMNHIHREMFSVNMPGSIQKQINDMLTSSAIVCNTR